jgi:hypothetical protein
LRESRGRHEQAERQHRGREIVDVHWRLLSLIVELARGFYPVAVTWRFPAGRHFSDRTMIGVGGKGTNDVQPSCQISTRFLRRRGDVVFSGSTAVPGSHDDRRQ